MTLLLLLLEAHEAPPPWKFVVSQILAFGLLAVILWVIVRPILAKMARDRSKGIEDAFAKLDAEIAETSRKVGEYKVKLANIEKEIQAHLAQAQAEGEKIRAGLMAEAAAAAAAEGERAKRDVAIERDKAVLEMRAAVTEATIAATERIVDGVMNDALNARVVGRNLDALEKAVSG